VLEGDRVECHDPAVASAGVEYQGRRLRQHVITSTA
jgi:hypothetical protein